MGKLKDWVVWCRSREADEGQRPVEVVGKEIFSNRSKQTKAKAGEKREERRQRAVSVLKSVVASEQHQMCSDRRVCFVLGAPRLPWHVANETEVALKKAAGASGGKDECQVRLKERERDYWMGTEISMLGGYGL